FREDPSGRQHHHTAVGALALPVSQAGLRAQGEGGAPGLEDGADPGQGANSGAVPQSDLLRARRVRSAVRRPYLLRQGCRGDHPAGGGVLGGPAKGPADYSPYHHPDASKKRQATVLRRMVEERFITPAEADAALAADVQFK